MQTELVQIKLFTELLAEAVTMLLIVVRYWHSLKS